MATATLTSKGQMTLPKDVRDDLQVGPGDQIDIIKQGGFYVLRARNVSVERIAGILGKSPAGQMTAEQEDDAYAQALAAEDERIRAGN